MVTNSPNAPRSFLDVTNKGKSKTSFSEYKEENKNSLEYLSRGDSNQDVSHFQKGYLSTDQRTGINSSYITTDLVSKIGYDATEISKNNKLIESKIKGELSTGFFEKLSHNIKSLISSDYRNQSTEGLIGNQLRRAANFSKLLEKVYGSIDSELIKSERRLNDLGLQYVSLVKHRTNTKKNISNLEIVAKDFSSQMKKEREPVRKGELSILAENKHREYRKALTTLDESNHQILENIKERKAKYDYEIIFERYGSAFKKVCQTANSEIRKIDDVKGLYINAFRGGLVVENLDKQFDNVFSSLRIIDGKLMDRVGGLIQAPGESNAIEDLSREQSENSQRLLGQIGENFVPSAENLDRMIEGYISGESKDENL